MESKLSVNFPLIIINIDRVGTNSLIGGLFQKLLEKDLVKDIGVLCPDEIVFRITSVHPDIDIYQEINAVRDMFKIEETKIKVFIN